jgi:hypothetical protein
MMISSLVSRNKRWIFEASHLLGLRFKVFRIFRSSSSIHRLFVFVELRWASCNEKTKRFWWIPELIWRFEQRSLRVFLVSWNPKINRYPLLLLRWFEACFNSSSSLLQTLRDRTMCLNCEGTNSVMKVLDESLRVRDNFDWFAQ